MMLERPGLLLNPWALRATTTTVQAPKSEGGWAGGGLPGMAGPAARSGRSPWVRRASR